MPERKILNEDLFYRGSSANLPRLHTCEIKSCFGILVDLPSHLSTEQSHKQHIVKATNNVTRHQNTPIKLFILLIIPKILKRQFNQEWVFGLKIGKIGKLTITEGIIFCVLFIYKLGRNGGINKLKICRLSEKYEICTLKRILITKIVFGQKTFGNSKDKMT